MKRDFSLSKNRLGIYFNAPEFSYSVQQGPEAAGKKDPALTMAIMAAFDAFNEVYNPRWKKRCPAVLRARERGGE